jgi:hypothetical protein
MGDPENESAPLQGGLDHAQHEARHNFRHLSASTCGFSIYIALAKHAKPFKDREAATQILAPIAAVAFGMTIFGLAFLLAVPRLG